MTASVRIDADGMAAMLLIPAGELPSADALARLIEAHGIVYGLDAQALLTAAMPARESRELVIARGLPPLHGDDGSVLQLVPVGVTVVEDEHGTVDWKAVGRLREVAEGETLLQLVAPGQGSPGMTVTGHPLAARPGAPARLDRRSGDGVAPAPGDPTRLVATRSGICAASKGGTISVLPEVMIAGDLDLHWGHIETTCPVKVRGDVRAGFQLRTTASAEIGGCIEDSRVSVQGDLTVKGGILPGQERVKAVRRLTCRHAEQRVIKAGDLEVTLDVRHCEIYATGGVLARSLAGGHTRLRGSLAVDRLGDQESTTTVVHAGCDPYISRLRELAATGHDQLVQDVLDLKTRAVTLIGRMRTETDPLRLAALHEESTATANRLRDARHRLVSCEAALALPADAGLERSAAIRVKLAVYPGTTLTIADAKPLVVRELIAGGVFAIKDGQVARV